MYKATATSCLWWSYQQVGFYEMELLVSHPVDLNSEFFPSPYQVAVIKQKNSLLYHFLIGEWAIYTCVCMCVCECIYIVAFHHV